MIDTHARAHPQQAIEHARESDDIVTDDARPAATSTAGDGREGNSGFQVDTLFRPAAVQSAQRRLEGSVILIQSTPMSVLVWIVVVMAALALAFTASFSYSSYERVSGALKSTGGDLKVYPDAAAVVETLFVSEGDVVEAGAPLAVLRRDGKAGRGHSDAELQRVELAQQIANLERNKQRAVDESDYELQKLRLDLDNARTRRSALARQVELLEQQLEIDRTMLAARERMRGSGHLSALDLEASKASALKTEERLLQVRTEHADTVNLIARNQADIDAFPGRLSRQIATIDNEISGLQRQMIGLNSQIAHTLRARQQGRVGNILALEGEVAQPEFPLLTLTAPDAELVAELYVPSRSRAFIREGLEVYIRFESFPAELYGDMRAVVVEVSDVMLFPDDWPNPMKIPRPVYRVLARLDRQSMEVDGEAVSLQQGLPIDADIVLERRSILDHLLAPILKVKSSLH